MRRPSFATNLRKLLAGRSVGKTAGAALSDRAEHLLRRTGAAPGSLHVDPRAAKPRLRMMAYGPSELEELEDATLEQVAARVGEHPITWIEVRGLGDADLLRALGERFDFHPLALEDVAHGQHPPKTEIFPDHVFLVTSMAEPGEDVDTSQVSFFVKKGLVVSLRESETDCFEPVRERIRRHGPRLRKYGADYLAYALVDALIDAYLPVLEVYGTELELLEDRILEEPSEDQLAELHWRRRELIALRKASWGHREAVQVLLRDAPVPFTEQTQVYLRDCYDHVLRIIDLVESYREATSSLMDVYLSSLGQRTNEVMKVLTIIATLFIPLSFLAGLYGMNFDTDSPWNLPELGWRYGYPALLGVMAVVADAFLWFFRRKGWL